MTKLHSHQLDIYGAWLHLATTPKQWRRHGDLIDSLPEIDNGAIGFTSRDITDDGAVHLSIYVDAGRLADNPAGLTEIIAHESTHAGGMLLDHIGQDYNGESEALAYLVGFIAGWIRSGIS